MSGRVKALLGMIVVSLFWAPSFSITKELLPFFGPATLVCLRFLGGAAVLLAVHFTRRAPTRIKKEDRLEFLVVTGMIPIHYVLSNVASLSLHETESIMFSSFQSLLTLIVASLLINSKIKPVTSTYIGMAGIGAVLLMEFSSSVDMVKIGYLIMLSAMLAWVVYCVLLVRLLDKYPVEDILLRQFFITGITMLPGLLFEENQFPLWDMGIYLKLAYLVVCCTVICFVLNAKGIDEIGPIPSSLVLIIGPVLVVVFNMGKTGLNLSPRQITGIFFVLAGICLAALDIVRQPRQDGEAAEEE